MGIFFESFELVRSKFRIETSAHFSEDLKLAKLIFRRLVKPKMREKIHQFGGFVVPLLVLEMV